MKQNRKMKAMPLILGISAFAVLICTLAAVQKNKR